MNLENLKTMLNIAQTDTSYDVYLTSMYDLCYKYAINYLDLIHPAIDRTYTYRDFYNKRIFKCPDKPVNAIRSAKLDGKDIPNPEYDSGYFYFPGFLLGNRLDITANVGYATIPKELDTIINMMVEFLFKQATKANYFSMPEQKLSSPKDMTFPAYIHDLLESI